ncbi:mannose-6-phosphate isomerase, class I [Microbacteriaceae bacterium VKM Ac-2855]|nr:mannose-6-phosphate isomerase, class I [Microbacteriaceae bacterium VKM Ac-2855]
MFTSIHNTPRDYAWGSRTGIAEALGTTPSGRPEAELWLGAHPGSPSRMVDAAAVGGAETLPEWIAAEPALTLGGAYGSVDPITGEPRLPFLLKILAAGGPLSLQAHPSSEVARRRFVEEDAAGIPRDAGVRNYKDPFHKPELIYAISETFDALCGFRPIDGARDIVTESITRAEAAGLDPEPLLELRGRLQGEAADALRGTVQWLLESGDRAVIAALVAVVVAVAEAAGGETHSLEYGTVLDLQREYSGDPGVVMSLLLNRVRLRRGEAIYLPAGNIHAYLLGTGVELMAASDNVLRGGLTPKHIDVPELLDVLDFTPVPVPYLEPENLGGGVSLYRPDVPDFVLAVVERAGDEAASELAITGPAIAIATQGTLSLVGAHSAITLGRGDSAFATPDEGALTITGHGTLFIATV